MIKRIGLNEFREEFNKMGRDNQFSYEGMEELFNYLEYFEEENEEVYELDVIELCTNFAEYNTLEEFNEDYGEDYEDIDDLACDVILIRVSQDSFIINTF